MAEYSEHFIVKKLREDRGYSDDAPQEEIFKREALLFALQPPHRRTDVLRDLNEAMFSPRDRYSGQPVEDTSTLREKAQLMRLERHYRNAHERLKAAGR